MGNGKLIPRVTLYCELDLLWSGFFYKKVGTGFLTSYKNQKKALGKSGIFFTDDLKENTNIFQANSHGPYTWYLAWKYKRHGSKVIFYAHATAEDLTKQFRIFHLFFWIIRSYLSRLYNFSDAVVCPSLYTANLLNTKYNVPKEKTIFISNGVDLEKFTFDPAKRRNWREENKISDNDILVADVAMVLKRKGIDTFVHMGKLFPDIKFAWFGKIFNVFFAPRVPALPPNVKFFGFVPDIRDAYFSTDIFLFPSYEEQQGISILEAGAVGLPILVRDIPVYQGWLKDGENCLKASTEEEFREKLIRLLSDHTLRARLGQTLHREVVDQHSFEKVGEKLQGLYEKLLNS